METGGAVYHTSNALIANWVNKFNLEATLHSTPEDEDDDLFAIWNGKEFVYEQSQYSLLSKASFVWRYGMSPITVDKWVKEVHKNFTNIYNVLPQPTVSSLLETLSLSHLSTVSLRSHLIENVGASAAYVDEFITGICRVNYGQDASIHALVGAVSILGVDPGKLACVVGGNNKVIQELIKHAAVQANYNSKVFKIKKLVTDDDNISYRVFYKKKEGDDTIEHHQDFDGVILGAPIELAEIEFEGFELPGYHKRKYQVTHVTFVSGVLDLQSYFDVPDGVHQPHKMFTTEENQEFNSIFMRRKGLNATNPEERLYKIFSRKEVSEELLNKLFKNTQLVKKFAWHAYPVLEPISDTKPFPPFRLDDKLFYANALESAFSTIETEAIAGKNVAKLLTMAVSK